jgi:hypothetical protein
MTDVVDAETTTEHSVVMSPMALPPRVLQAWMRRQRGAGKLGAVDTISIHSIFDILEHRRGTRDKGLREMVLRWYGECLHLHRCPFLDLVMPNSKPVSDGLKASLRSVYRKCMPTDSASLQIRRHVVPIPEPAVQITKIVILCVDPRIQELENGLIADIESTRLLRIPGPDDTFAGLSSTASADRLQLVKNLRRFMRTNDCRDAQICIAGHEGCGKRNFVQGGHLTAEEDLAVMVRDTEKASLFLREQGFNVKESELNDTGAHFVVKGSQGEFEVATMQPQ